MNRKTVLIVLSMVLAVLLIAFAIFMLVTRPGTNDIGAYAVLMIGLLALFILIAGHLSEKRKTVRADNNNDRNKDCSGQRKTASRQRTAQDADPAWMYSPAVILAQGLFERLMREGHEELLTSNYTPPFKLKSRDLASIDQLYPKVHTIMFDMIRYLGLPPFVRLELIYQETDTVSEPHAAGQFRSRPTEKVVSVKVNKMYAPINIMAILCHECTHYFMEYHHLNVDDTDINEERTDAAAMLIGFHSIIAKGYRPIVQVKNEGNQTRTTTLNIGYISYEDCLDIQQFLYHERLQILDERAKKDALNEEKKSAAQHLETAADLFELVSALDPRNAPGDYTASAEQLQALQEALMEFEVRDIQRELDLLRQSIGTCLTIDCVHNLNKKIESLCGDLIRWSSAFQGITGSNLL